MAMTEQNLKKLNDTTAVMITEKAVGQLMYDIQEYSKNITSSAIEALTVAATSASNSDTAYYLSQISQTDGKIIATAVTVEQSYDSNGIKPVSGKSIEEAINTLNVDSTSASDTTTAYYISQISETNGKITATAVTVEQIYSSTGVTPVSGKSIAAAIAELDSSTTTAASGQVIKGITITDGKISNSDFLNLNPSLSSISATGDNTQELKVSVGGVTAATSIALNKATTTTYGVIKKHSTTSTTLSFSASATSATVSVTGVTTSNTIIVSPLANDTISIGGGDTLSSWEIWRDAGVRCSDQAANQLTFKADETPAADTKFNVIILD